MIVVDASVASKWFLREEETSLATNLLEQPEPLVAPELVRLEVFSAVTKAVRTKRISLELAQQYCHSWTEYLTQGAIGLVPDEADIVEAVKLSLEKLHPIQDCLYLALAKRLQMPLATLDKKLIAIAKLCKVELVKLSS